MSLQTRSTTFRCAAPHVPVSDMTVAVAYYQNRLGFAIYPVMTDSASYWMVAGRNGVELHLVKDTDHRSSPIHFSILVDSLDSLAAELLARHALFESGPTNQEYGYRDFSVLDPDGNRIVFWQPLPPPNSNPPTEAQRDYYSDDQPF